MRRKINYSLNIKRVKKLKNSYKLMSIKLDAVKKVNNKKKNKKTVKTLLNVFIIKRKITTRKIAIKRKRKNKIKKSFV
jgi:hypothetical protein